MLSAGRGAPLAHRGEKLRRTAAALGDGVGAGDEEAAVVVGAPDHGLQPGSRPVRPDTVLGGQAVHSLWGERVQHPDDGLVVALRPCPVARLEDVEQKQQLLHCVAVEASVEIEQRMGDKVDDALRTQQSHEFIDVLTGRQQVGELPLRDAEGDDVQAAARLGQVGAQFGAQEGPRQVRDLERPGDRVVVRDGDEVHPASVGGIVDGLGRGEALGAAHGAQQPARRGVGVAGVDVQIGSADLCHRNECTRARAAARTSPAGNRRRGAGRGPRAAWQSPRCRLRTRPRPASACSAPGCSRAASPPRPPP